LLGIPVKPTGDSSLKYAGESRRKPATFSNWMSAKEVLIAETLHTRADYHWELQSGVLETRSMSVLVQKQSPA
jgi:hypothetical protein